MANSRNKKILVGAIAVGTVALSATLASNYLLNNKEAQPTGHVAATEQLITLQYPSLPDVIIRNLDDFNFYYYKGTGSAENQQIVNSAAQFYAYFLGQIANINYNSAEYQTKVQPFIDSFIKVGPQLPLLYADFSSFLNSESAFFRDNDIAEGFGYPALMVEGNTQGQYQLFKANLNKAITKRIEQRVGYYKSENTRKVINSGKVQVSVSEYEKDVDDFAAGFNQALNTLTEQDLICNAQSTIAKKGECYTDYVKLVTSLPAISAATYLLNIADLDQQMFIRKVYNQNITNDVVSFYNTYVRDLELPVYYSK